MNDDAEKDTCVTDETINKECNAEEVDMSVKALKGVPAKNCETPPKKEKKKIMDQVMSLTPVSSSFFIFMITIMCVCVANPC